MDTKNSYKIIGLMSGTSLDGLDVAYCDFYKQKGQWKYQLIEGIEIEYPKEILETLKKATSLSGLELTELDHQLGKWIGESVANIIKERDFEIQYISSHGHTIFHQPENGFTLQIGNANQIAAITQLPVISDFRTLDVALGGQGAPLVPIGDRLLFSDFEVCINLGGIANLSYEKENTRIAYDISPCNMPINYLASKLGHDYDKNGELARKGTLIDSFFHKFNELKFYKAEAPKSLGYEWVQENILSYLDSSSEPLEDLLHTITEHSALQIANAINQSCQNNGRALFTGGGTFNVYLIERIQHYLRPDIELVIPSKDTIKFKEAIIFAFLGVLRLENKINCLASVTGASQDSVGGSVITL